MGGKNHRGKLNFAKRNGPDITSAEMKGRVVGLVEKGAGATQLAYNTRYIQIHIIYLGTSPIPRVYTQVQT